MKAAYFRLPEQIEVRDIPRPQPKSNEVLVRVERCGICGWDTLQFTEGERDWHQRGHEYAGVVEQVPDDIQDLDVGDRVAGIGSLPCGQCTNCRRGKPKYCLNPDGAGVAAFAEFACAPPRLFFPIPDLTADEGALIEPLTVAIQMVRDAGVTMGTNVLLMGAGPIGLMALAICTHSGAAAVDVSQPARSTARLELAREWGARQIVYPYQEDIVRRLKKFEPHGYESVLVTIKPSDGITQAMELSAPGGTISLIGMEGADEAKLVVDIDTWHFKRAKLVGSNHNPNGLLYREGARLLHKGIIDAEHLVTHTFGLSEIETAFEFLTNRKSEVAKVMIDPQE